MAKTPLIPQRQTGPTPKSLRNQTTAEREQAKSKNEEYAEEAAAAAEADNGEYALLESSDALADRLSQSEEFVRRNRNLLLGALGLVVLIVAGAFAFYQWRGSRNEEAQAAMFPATNYFESDSLKQALNGDGQNPGMLTIADQYSGTKAGNLAHFYAGVALLKQGKFAEAQEQLKKFSSDDMLVQARAYALEGDATMELKNYAEAGDLYLKAANYKTNNLFSPQYLMKAALAQEMAKSYDEAVKTYDRVINEFQTAAEVNDAKRYRARAQGLAGK